jgi:hypothetical protein
MAPRQFGEDEERGKRDDEYRPAMKPPSRHGTVWPQGRVTHGPIRRSIKRVALAIFGLFMVYLFIHNLPTDLEPRRGRPSYTHDTGSPGQHARKPLPSKSESSKKSSAGYSGTSRPVKEKEEVLHDFNGPIKYYDLAASLHAASAVKGAASVNRNVVGELWPFLIAAY